ncbi:MAG: metalloregulator ArsR/SmtB family transcription factor [Paracoccaceae bacterium]
MTNLVRIFAALADETRFAMVERMLKEGEQPAGDLVSQVKMTAPAVSRHLKILRQAGVIRQRAEGTRRLYSVCPEALQAISGWTIDHGAFWEASLDRLAAYMVLEKGSERD